MHDRIATTGFSRMSDRQLGLWDVRNPVEPIDGFQSLDSISGVCMPFWDDGNKMLYLAGKGYVSNNTGPVTAANLLKVMEIFATSSMKTTSSSTSPNTSLWTLSVVSPSFQSEEST